VAGHVWADRHDVRTIAGTAMRANDENDLVMFDADDGTQLPFHADAVTWTSGDDGTSGDGRPLCLSTPLEQARVEVGVVKASLPGEGGRADHVVWVRCP